MKCLLARNENCKFPTYFYSIFIRNYLNKKLESSNQQYSKYRQHHFSIKKMLDFMMQLIHEQFTLIFIL